jgi:hypothetical protein
MHGYALPKASDLDAHSKKSSFNYNYCMHEADPTKPLPKFKDTFKPSENYLKLGLSHKQAILAAEVSTNELLLR